MARGGGIERSEGGGKKLRPKESAAQKLARTGSPGQRRRAGRALEGAAAIRSGTARRESAATKLVKSPSATKQQRQEARAALEGGAAKRSDRALGVQRKARRRGR